MVFQQRRHAALLLEDESEALVYNEAPPTAHLGHDQLLARLGGGLVARVKLRSSSPRRMWAACWRRARPRTQQ